MPVESVGWGSGRVDSGFLVWGEARFSENCSATSEKLSET
jgi:hypothetical protein